MVACRSASSSETFIDGTFASRLGTNAERRVAAMNMFGSAS